MRCCGPKESPATLLSEVSALKISHAAFRTGVAQSLGNDAGRSWQKGRWTLARRAEQKPRLVHSQTVFNSDNHVRAAPSFDPAEGWLNARRFRPEPRPRAGQSRYSLKVTRVCAQGSQICGRETGLIRSAGSRGMTVLVG